MKKLKRLRKSKKGMSLVELVVAIALICIVFSAAMSGIVHGYMSVVKNKNIEQASMQAKGVADTVVSAINEVLSDSSITDKDNAIIDVIDGSISHTTGLNAKNNFTYYNQLSGSTPTFPNSTSTSDIQVTVEKITNLGVTKMGAASQDFNGYKVMVAARCDNSYDTESYVTVTATSIEYRP